MNLKIFLQTVNDLNEKLTHEDLKKFVYVMAQKWPERNRESFLQQLQQIGDQSVALAAAKESLPLPKDYKSVMAEVEEILAGKYHLDSEYNERYDEWYHDEEDEFIFADNEGVLAIIDRAVKMVHTLTDYALYKEAYGLAEKLLAVKLEITGDYADYGDCELSIEDLEQWGLLDFDYKQWFREVLYLAYVVTPQRERPGVIYQLLEREGDSFVNYIADLAEAYRDIPQWEDFLQQWLDYLGEKTGILTEKLIVEGIDLLRDKEVSVAMANKYAAVHPVYWNALLEHKPQDFSNEEWYEFGRQAINKINEKYVMRSTIALLTADYAMRMGRDDLAEECWVEAYRSHSTPVNYLRVLAETSDFSRVQAQMEEIRLKVGRETEESGYSYGMAAELITNRGSQGIDGLNALVAGDYYAVKELALPQAVLFVLLLMHDAKQKGEGCRWACSYVQGMLMFRESEYLSGLWGRYTDVSADVFSNVVKKWCERKPLTRELQCRAIDLLAEEVPQRLASVLTAKERNRYGECAALLALLGEAKEAWGDLGYKEKIMQTYHEKYRRFTAFTKELKKYGMQG